MRTRKLNLLCLVFGLLFAAGSVWAAQSKPAKQPRASKPAAAAVAKTHTMSGTIVSSTPSRLVLSHQKSGKAEQMTFVLNPDTRIKGTLKDGEHATVKYRVENNENVSSEVMVAGGAGKAKKTK